MYVYAKVYVYMYVYASDSICRYFMCAACLHVTSHTFASHTSEFHTPACHTSAFHMYAGDTSTFRAKHNRLFSRVDDTGREQDLH